MIIIINGTSSSGKSTLSAKLQNRLGDGWLFFSTDGYLGMLGSKFDGLHPDNKEVCEPNDICYAKAHDDGTYEIVPGALCSKLYVTIPAALQLLAMQGFNIIVDSFITTMDDFLFYREKLEKHGLLFIYLYAPELVISAREEARGDRLKGSALHWLKSFECEPACDLKFDTSELNINEITNTIVNYVSKCLSINN